MFGTEIFNFRQLSELPDLNTRVVKSRNIKSNFQQHPSRDLAAVIDHQPARHQKNFQQYRRFNVKMKSGIPPRVSHEDDITFPSLETTEQFAQQETSALSRYHAYDITVQGQFGELINLKFATCSGWLRTAGTMLLFRFMQKTCQSSDKGIYFLFFEENTLKFNHMIK